MKSNEFKTYQQETLQRFQRILQSHADGQCDEQGLPSYTNPNLFMRWITWKRVSVVLRSMESLPRPDKVLDFGCGYGVFLPYLSAQSGSVTAFDLMVDEVRQIGQTEGWRNIEYLGDFKEIASRKDTYDLILAIEVLEHVEDLENTVSTFAQILTENGHFIVSGPTENLLYRTGRKLAGYSGEYHERNIYDIKKVLDGYFRVRKIATLLPLMPIYEIYDCTRLP
jgi:2-polyprenyl-3-methyl-5-hydroxy-6-metoxy-1,4-benzoquinol methylase